MKIEKISKLALWISAGLSILVFAIFFILGEGDEYIGDKTVPVFTDGVMWLMYLMALATTLLTLWGVWKGIQCNRGNDSASTTGVPGGKVTLGVIVLLVASLVIGYVAGMGEETFVAADGTETAAGWVQLVDVFCYSIGILTIAAAVAVGVSMSGVLTKNASK